MFNWSNVIPEYTQAIRQRILGEVYPILFTPYSQFYHAREVKHMKHVYVSLCIVGILLSQSLLTHAATFLGPTPYLQFSDSPFNSGTIFN